MKRRELLSLGSLAVIEGAFGPLSALGVTCAQNAAPAEGQTRVLRIYEDLQGDSHFEELVVATAPRGRSREAQLVPAAGVYVREYPPDEVVDWHTAPGRQFAITLVGQLEVEVSSGMRHRVRAGELVFLEDTKGKGHITRLQGRVTNLFIRVPDSFDVVAWARAKA